MKPTLKDLEDYKKYLIKNQLFDTIKEHLEKQECIENPQIVSIQFNGNYEYDDEGSNYFYLASIHVDLGEDSFEYGWDHEILLDRCWNVSKLLNQDIWESGYNLKPDDLTEPFQLVKS